MSEVVWCIVSLCVGCDNSAAMPTHWSVCIRFYSDSIKRQW